MLDSGSSVSLIRQDIARKITPVQVTKQSDSNKIKLVTASGAALPILQQVEARVSFDGLESPVSHSFLVVKSLISPVRVGVDFLQQQHLSLDFSYCPVRVHHSSQEAASHNSSSEQKKYSSTTAAISSKNAEPEGNEDLQIEQCAILKFKKTDDVTLPEVEDKTLWQLLEKYKDLFRNSPGVTTLTHHFIPTSGSPIRVPPRRIPAEYRQKVDKLIKDMLAEGIIEESSSPWMAPAVYTKKKSGEIRLCVDYRALNKNTVKDAYLCHFQMRFKIDCQGLGLFHFLRMPFGLSGAPASFQCLMNKLFRDVSFVTTYLDDILIHSKTQAEHVGHLAVVLSRLKDAGLTLRGHKCKIGLKKVHYLEHVFTTEGMAPDRRKVQAVKDWPVLSDATELTEKGTMYSWTPECDASFNALKKQLTQAPILAYPKFGSGAGQFVLATDASNTGIGAVLEQEGRVVAYASRTLSKSEKNYSVIQNECLAIVYATKQFRHYLLGRPFTVVTDHAPLQWLSAQKIEGLLCRWALALQEYDFHIEYKKGSSNSNADALSRRPTYQPSDVVSAVRTEVDIAALGLRYAQEHDPHLNQVLLGLKASHVRPPKWRQYPLRSYAHLWSNSWKHD
ncbi:hypothetical protein EMCRGX_G011611 [Ephydatia muelleri]